MKHYLTALACVSLLVSSPVHATGDGADFSRLVAVGDGYTGGVHVASLYDGTTRPASEGGPFRGGQPSGYVIQMTDVMVSSVVSPSMSYPGLSELGIVTDTGTGCDQFGFTITPTTTHRINPNEAATNVAVPGQKLGDMLRKRWSIDPLDPRTVDSAEDFILGFPYAFQGGSPASQIETAVALDPTFLIVWAGMEDALDAAMNADASRLTPAASFRADARTLFRQLGATGAQGVVATIPDVTLLPGLFSREDLARISGGDVDTDTIGALTGMGPNDYVPIMEEEGIIYMISSGVAAPLGEHQVLRANEVRKIRKRITQYNRTIASLAAANGWAVLDLNDLYLRANGAGIVVAGHSITMEYKGGFCSIDGTSNTMMGNALIATEFVKAINAHYGTTIPLPDLEAIAAVDPELCQ